MRFVATLSLLGSLSLAVPALAQQGGAAIAVLPFRNEQSLGLEADTYRALESGIAELVRAELARSPGARTVERDRVRAALGTASEARRIDAATARTIGNAVGARYVVMGNFVDAFGRLRLNAQIVDAADGRIVAAATNEPAELHDRARLDDSIDHVCRALLAAVNLPAPAAAPAVPLDGIVAFSMGLAAEQGGDRSAAAGYYRQALERAPSFAEARAGLARVS